MDSITPNSKTAPHVAIISFPLGSHPSTLFTIAKILEVSAPLGSFICTSKSFSSLSQHSLQTQNLKLCHGFKFEDESDFFKNMTPYFKEGIDIAIKNEGGLKLTCIVADGLMPDIGKIAWEMNVTWIQVRCTGPALILMHFYYKELKQAYEEEEDHDKPISGASISPSLSVLKFKDIQDFLVSGEAFLSLNTGTAEEFECCNMLEKSLRKATYAYQK